MIYFLWMKKLNPICNRVIEYSFYFLFFLVPLIMTPWNYELFEFNKMLLVYFFTILIIATWLIKMIADKKFLFKRSFWDIPLLIFLISQFLSFLISIDRHTSLWGYYSRFNGGLASIFCYLLLYWAFVNNMDKRKTLYSIFYVLCSATLVALYGVAEHFGIDAQAWVQDVRNRVFSTLGQPNWLAAWLIAIIPLTWGFALKGEKQRLFIIPFRRNPTLWAYSLFIILFLCLLYTKSRSGLLGFFAAFIVFWLGLGWINRKRLKTIIRPFLIFTFSFLVLSFVIGTPWTPNIFKVKSEKLKVKSEEKITENSQSPPILISESGDIRKVVWKGALDVWKHSPIFGTGVETFAYSYYWQRPREHNDLSEWDFLYNKAHNEYLNYMATTGTVGIISYLILICSYFFWSIKTFRQFRHLDNLENEKEKNLYRSKYLYLYISIFSGFISILVTNFFGFSVVAVNLLFFLLPAMSVILSRVKEFTPRVHSESSLRGVHSEEQESKRVEKQFSIHPWQLAIISLILLSTIYYLLSTIRYWYADVRFALGEKLSKGGQTNQAFTELQKAVQIRPEPIYCDELGITAAELAVAAFQQKQATLSAQLTKFAIKESDNALKISPYNVNFWKNRTRLFYALAEIDPKYNQEALKSLLKAYTLAPTDAKIAYNLGVLYSKLGQEETALQILEKTVALKPNYDQARYALGLFYEKQGKIDKAKEQFQYIIEKINPNYEPVVEKLKTLK